MIVLSDEQLRWVAGGTDNDSDIVVIGTEDDDDDWPEDPPRDPWAGEDDDFPPPSSPTPPPPPPPSDEARDTAIDKEVCKVAKQIAALSAQNHIEYGAFIWEDAHGELHLTDITPGVHNRWTGSKDAWNQVDWAHGAKVVGQIHSHPSDQNTGSIDNPVWTDNPHYNTLSSTDFDLVIDAGRGQVPGLSADFRSYLVTKDGVSEYNFADQDETKRKAGGQADWAVKSQSYHGCS